MCNPYLRTSFSSNFRLVYMFVYLLDYVFLPQSKLEKNSVTPEALTTAWSEIFILCPFIFF